MKKIHRLITALLLLATLPSCSMLTASGRRQAAYERYVRKCSAGRFKQRKHLIAQQQKVPKAPASEPVENVGTGPESVTSGEGGQ